MYILRNKPLLANTPMSVVQYTQGVYYSFIHSFIHVCHKNASSRWVCMEPSMAPEGFKLLCSSQEPLRVEPSTLGGQNKVTVQSNLAAEDNVSASPNASCIPPCLFMHCITPRAS